MYCPCVPRPRIVKTRVGKWVCSGCRRERSPKPRTLQDVTFLRTDTETGERSAASLSAFRHDLEDGDVASALDALITQGEAATPNPWYELKESA